MLNQGHIPSLDGFRAIAVLLVIFSHLAIRGTTNFEEENFLTHFTFGGAGVRIFFVISGFLITYLLFVERKRTGSVDLRKFYIRRLLRIFPVFYFYLFVLVILNLFLDLKIPFIVFLSGGLYIHNFHPWGSHWFINHSWSLAVEEQFYLLWPFIFKQTIHLKISVWISMLVMGSLIRAFHYKYPDLANYFLAPFLVNADFLFSGCFMAHVIFYNQDQVVRYFNKAKSYLVYISIIAIGFFSAFEFHPIYDKIFIPMAGSVINVCICFLILYFVINERSIGYTFLNFPIITFIGRLSYSLYVWQQLFISNSGFWFSEFPQNIILTFLTAYLSYKMIERPFLKLKERFKPQLETKMS